MMGVFGHSRRQNRRKAVPFLVVRVLLAALLFSAAVLKSIDPLAQVAAWYVLPLVLFEIFLAAWLLSGFHARSSWYMAVFCFGCFACVAAAKGLTGSSNCGCFGSTPISPWIALAIDVSALLLLSISMPENRRAADGERRFQLQPWIVLIAYTGLTMFAVVRFTAPTTAGEVLDRGLTRTGSWVIVEPHSWVGAKCPLIEQIDIGPDLNSNRWLMLLYHFDCPRCEVMLRWLVSNATSPVAIISVPPHAKQTQERTSAGSKNVVAWGRLPEGVNWFVETPALIVLKDGIVESVFNPVAEGELRDLRGT